MKIKVYNVYIEGIPNGKKCSRGKWICKWYYSIIRMCGLFNKPVTDFYKCDKCVESEKVF